MAAPQDFACRSFVYRKLAERGASFEALGDFAVARDFGDPAAEAEAARRMGLADLSPLARLGVKGAGTADWLAGQGIKVPEESNRAVRQASGVLAARLAPAELFLLAGLAGEREPIDAIANAWRAESQPPASPQGYLVPRQHSHFWFLVTGDCAAPMFAKLCGVDLRPGKFPDGQIAQTSLARMTGLIVRDDQRGTLAYHVLGDGASGEYLWDCLLDAMVEFDGAPVGLDAVRGLAGAAGS